MDPQWSQIPAELVHEITNYNADDMSTLRAMSLVSKKTRSFAAIHLFSAVHFSCVEDFPWWLEILNRTPALATHVKKVKFSGGRSQRSMDRLNLASVTRLSDRSIIPVLPSLPNVDSVELVEWNNGSIPITMLTTQMSLYPHIRELRLDRVQFYYYTQLVAVIGACGSGGTLRTLSFERVLLYSSGPSRSDSGSSSDSESAVQPSSPPAYDTDEPDLSELKQLIVQECNHDIDDESDMDFDDCIGRLITEYPPAGLRTLTFGYTHEDDRSGCSLSATENLLRSSTSSVVSLTMDPMCDQNCDPDEILDMFDKLPAFQALETLTIWLHPDRMAQQVINALKDAPKLTRLVFRIWLYGDSYNEDRQDLNLFVDHVFPWGGPDSMKTVLTRKFPLCREIAFHLCLPRKSAIHFRRGVGGSMERQLQERLEKTRADIAAYLRIEWLDEEFQPVVYRKNNGKPLWSFDRDHKGGWESEPETEDSDWESESERQYRGYGW